MLASMRFYTVEEAGVANGPVAMSAAWGMTASVGIRLASQMSFRNEAVA